MAEGFLLLPFRAESFCQWLYDWIVYWRYAREATNKSFLKTDIPMASKIELSFQCPQKWEAMTPTKGGRFCSHCQKTVIDFTHIPVQQPDPIIQQGDTAEICGNFYAYQLHKPFGNWRDHVIAFSQRFEWGQSSYKQLTVLLLTMILLLTGCARRFRGKVGYDTHKRNHNHSTRTLDPQQITK